MHSLTLDASAAIRVVMDSAAQPGLLEVLASAGRVYAPTLLVTESANALWKYRRAGRLTRREVLQRHDEVLALVDEFVDDRTLFPEAGAMAMQAEHPVYDCLYATVSRRYAAALISFDQRLLALCEAQGIETVDRHLQGR